MATQNDTNDLLPENGTTYTDNSIIHQTSTTTPIQGTSYVPTFSPVYVSSGSTVQWGNPAEDRVEKLLRLMEELVIVLKKYEDKGNWSQSSQNDETRDRWCGKGDGWELAEQLLEKVREEYKEENLK